MALLKLGGAILGGTIFVGTAYVTGLNYAPAPKYEVTDAARKTRFEEIANSYYNDTKNQEFYLGIRNMRRQLVKEAKGDVLEIGAGTGTMVGMYPFSGAPLFDDASDDEGKDSKKTLHLTKAAQAKKDEGGVDPFAALDPKGEEEMQALHNRKAGVGIGVRSVTMTDRALRMLDQCEAKIESKVGYKPHRLTEAELDDFKAGAVALPDTTPTADAFARVAEKTKELHPLYQTAAVSSESIPFPDNSFDTVVDVFGLCSFDDPVAALMEMSRVCKPGGELLLIEHGRGTYPRINAHLDKWAPRHAKSWGCWWNRDIRRYLRLAGIKPDERVQKHFGTTHKVRAKPNKTWTLRPSAEHKQQQASK